jgi:hypothetical protein
MTGFGRSSLGCAAVFVALVAGQGCAAVTYQDAKLVGKGNVELTPTVTRVGFAEGGESEAIGTGFGGTVTLGLSDKVDFMAGYVRFDPKGLDEGGANFAGGGPKFSLKRDRLALLLPVTFAFGDDVDVSETVQFSPSAIFSVPLGDKITFNPSARVVFSNCEDCDVLVGAQAGFSFPMGSSFTLRPEIGALFNPGESGVIWTFGAGLSFRTR